MKVRILSALSFDDTVRGVIFFGPTSSVRVSQAELPGLGIPEEGRLELELEQLPILIQERIKTAAAKADAVAKADEAKADAAAKADAHLNKMRETAKFTLISSSWWGIQKAANWRHIKLDGAAIKYRRPHNQGALLPVKGFVEPIGDIATVEMEYFNSAQGLLSALGDYNPATKTITATHTPKGNLIGQGGETIRAISAIVGFRVNIA